VNDRSQLPTARATAAYGSGPEPTDAAGPTGQTAARGQPTLTPGPLLDDREKYLQRIDHRATVGRMRSLVPWAASGWVAFFALDVIVALWIYPTSLLPFVWLRLAGLTILLGAGMTLRRAPDPSPGFVLALDLAMIVTTSACLSMMGLFAGGVSSPYHALVVLVMLGRVAVIPHRWQDAIWRLAVPAIVDVLIVGIASAALSSVRAQWLEPASRGGYVFFAALLFGSWMLVVVGSHHAWALRRQVFASRSLGRFKLRERIGRGGMGEVWIALDEELGRDVALKVLRPDERDPEGVVRFEREIKATAALRHPNTIRIFNHGVSEDGLLYYAMELLEGETLQALVDREGPLPPERAVGLVHQAARALAEAHGRGILHRDIKPENIFVTTLAAEADVVKVLDFGIAQLRDEAGITSTGFVTGTPAYMAPEVASGGEATTESDVYGLGATLFFALTGQTLYDGADAASVMRQHIDAPVPRVGVCSPHPISTRLEEVVMRTLAKDPQVRFENASDLAETLTV